MVDTVVDTLPRTPRATEKDLPPYPGGAGALRKELESEKTTQPLKIERKSISGTLDLQHFCVKRPIEITGCHFYGDVDVRYCEFEQAVDFTDCEFDGRFNSGDLTRSRTVYKKDLICNRAIFHGPVGFNGADIAGSAYFNNATFDRLKCGVPSDQAEMADFTGARCGWNFECSGATFGGSVSFNGLRCRTGHFCGAQFEHDESVANFRAAAFEVSLHCEPIDGKEDAKPQPTTFKGGLDFRGVRSQGRTLFRGAVFERRDREACVCADRAVSFDYASFGWLLDFTDAIFWNGVSFRRVECEGEARFDTAFFGGGFEDRAPVAQKDGGAAVDFRNATFNGDLRFENATFFGTVDFGQATIKQKLHLERASFYDKVGLYDAGIGTVVLWSRGAKKPEEAKDPKTWATDQLPFKKPGVHGGHGLDLTGCRFDRFHGSQDAEVEWCFAREFAGAQDPKRFSRDPYLRLEQYYRGEGDEQRADAIHYLGHKALWSNARSELLDGLGDTHWSPQQWARQILFGWPSGWGTRLWLLVLFCAVVIGVGYHVYSGDGALAPAKVGATAAIVTTAADTGTSIGGVGSASSDRLPNRRDLVLYSTDVFLPVVGLGYDDDWVTANESSKVCYAAEEFLGWFFIPLVVGSLTGLVGKFD
ncbi:MAG TPA: pentapeptide repeat-containing protein [Thermomicrobiales bacterium]|jgi:hypothetical protein